MAIQTINLNLPGLKKTVDLEWTPCLIILHCLLISGVITHLYNWEWSLPEVKNEKSYISNKGSKSYHDLNFL